MRAEARDLAYVAYAAELEVADEILREIGAKVMPAEAVRNHRYVIFRPVMGL